MIRFIGDSIERKVVGGDPRTKLFPELTREARTPFKQKVTFGGVAAQLQVIIHLPLNLFLFYRIVFIVRLCY